MNYTPEEEYRLTGKLVGRNAEDALEALASAETERETARSIGSWAPSAGDYADELYELARLAARPAAAKSGSGITSSRIRTNCFSSSNLAKNSRKSQYAKFPPPV